MSDRVGLGCEGEVWVSAAPDGTRVRVKRYLRRAELERFVVGAELLRHCLARSGWSRNVVVPTILSLDVCRLTVTSAPFVVTVPGPWSSRLASARARATASVICAAGQAAALGRPEVRALAEQAYGPQAGSLSRLWFEGVDLQPDSLLTDGHDWHLVDF